MSKNLIIVGMGPGSGLGLAEKFGANGVSFALVSRHANKQTGYQTGLSPKDIESSIAPADAYDATERGC